MKNKHRESLEVKDTVDRSRRKLLGKAAYVAPVLTFLTMSKAVGNDISGPPDPPGPTSQSSTSQNGRTKSRRKERGG